MDNVYKNQRGFVIGSGPSIKYENNLHKLKNEITVGTNGSFTHITPIYLVLLDNWFWSNFKQTILNLNCTIIAPDYILPNKQRKNKPDNVTLVKYNKKTRKIPESFSEPMWVRNNTGSFALLSAFLLGIDPIYLVGIDLNLEDIKKGELRSHNLYDNSPKKTKLVQYTEFIRDFNTLISEIRKRGVSIYTCSPRCTLNVEYVNLESI